MSCGHLFTSSSYEGSCASSYADSPPDESHLTYWDHKDPDIMPPLTPDDELSDINSCDGGKDSVSRDMPGRDSTSNCGLKIVEVTVHGRKILLSVPDTDAAFGSKTCSTDVGVPRSDTIALSSAVNATCSDNAPEKTPWQLSVKQSEVGIQEGELAYGNQSFDTMLYVSGDGGGISLPAHAHPPPLVLL